VGKGLLSYGRLALHATKEAARGLNRFVVVVILVFGGLR
jgi:hypothetical protein